MNQAFECPNCGAPLTFPRSDGAVVSCPYCASTVIVPASLRQSWPACPPVPAVTRHDLYDLNAVLQEINWLISSGERIEAIRLYKDHFGVGLKEAKESVERIERGDPVLLSQVSVCHAEQLKLTIPEIEADLRQLLENGKKLEAIKSYRDIFGEGLSESKDAVEAFENGEDLPIPIGWRQSWGVGTDDPARALAEVANLAQEGHRLAAVQAYRRTFDSSQQEAEQVVERLAQDAETDPTWIAAQVQADLASSRVVRPAAPEKKARTASCLYAGVAVFMIASILLPLLAGLAQAGGPLSQTWQRLNPASYARLVDSFGRQGTSPAQFSDPRAVAIGPDGSLYVGDYVDGRIQHLASHGQFLNQWFTQEESYLGSLAVDRNNTVYATYQGEIWRFDGPTGEALGMLPNPAGLYFNYAVLAPDDGLLAIASGEDLVRLDKNGQVRWRIESAISSISGDSELDTRLAVDGLGYIYALGTFNSAVFKYSPEGRFLNRWGSAGDEPGQLRAPNAIAVDGYGRVVVSDIHGVQVFAGQDGRFLDRFEVPGVVLAIAFDQQNGMYAVSKDHRVYYYRLKEPQPMVSNLHHPDNMVRSGLVQLQ